MKTKLKPAIAYVRVSTEGQGKDGHGLELQRVRIEAFAKRAGYELVQTFSDIETGMGEESIRNREGVVSAIQLARADEIPILVDGLDRFSRNVKAIEKVVLAGRLKVISCQSGEGASHAVIAGEAARAQRVGELISISTKLGLQKLKDQGVRLGNPTNLDEAQAKGAAANKAQADKRLRELIPVVRELRADGHTTAKAIAEGLNLRKILTARGGTWGAGNVRRVVDRIDELDRIAQQQRNLQDETWGTW